MTDKLFEELRRVLWEETNQASREDWLKKQSETDVSLYNYRLDHVMHAVEIADVLCEGTDVDKEAVRIATLLHDVAKPGMHGKSNHGIEGGRIARELLEGMGLSQEKIDLVCDCIAKHVGLTLEEPLRPLEAQIVWEADKLSKIGVFGLLHLVINGLTYAPGQDMHEIASEMRKFSDLAYDIAGSMHTPRAKEMAKSRVEHIRFTVESIEEELALNT